ncbi:GIY-YIG nuclease family protein [Salisaeta longa]|uniref:GIY-YIG nuclease family protein n=1 Tax=Salisaeta longa TaxID=503170 RepID=UPI0003B3E90E|nr:GIY-YIG nuclease family protein [Salisaeta longa]
MMAALLRNAPGTYVLWLHADSVRTVTVGARGPVTLQPGWYAYVGSARGPGGLRARVQRHARRQKNAHWHIDYLREALTLRTVWLAYDASSHECTWAAALRTHPVATSPRKGLGSSDCACPTHFIRWNAPMPSRTLLSDASAAASLTVHRWMPT